MTRRFATETLAPVVRKMDEEQLMDPEILQGCFDTGESHLASMLG